MTAIERLTQWWTSATRRLLAWAPANVWLSVGAIVVVLAWGAIDPFKLRQRLDWGWADQLLLWSPFRQPPPIDENLVLIAIDDHSTELLQKSDARHRLGQAVRQLESLGARTVLLDQLLFESGTTNPFDREEALFDGIPTAELQMAELQLPAVVKNIYTEDRLLAKSLLSLESLVLPFKLDPETPAESADDAAKIARMKAKLVEQPDLTEQALAQSLDINVKLARSLYATALKRAAEEIARKPEVAAKILQGAEGEATSSAFVEQLKAAHERDDVVRLLASLSSFDAIRQRGIAVASDVQLPLAPFVRGVYPSLVQLRTADIRDWGRFCESLIAEREDDDSTFTPGSRIFRLLPQAARDAVEECKKGGQLDQAKQSEIVSGFEGVLSNPDFYQDSHFENVDFEHVRAAEHAKSIFLQVQLGKRQLFPEEIEGLNRVLLEAAYPESILTRGRPRVARLGFADSKLDSDDDGGVLRRLPLVAVFQRRVVVHAGLAALAEHLGGGVQNLKLDGTRLELSTDRVARLDSAGRLVINWPMNQRVDWKTAIKPIPLAAFLQLARYDSDLLASRQKLRRIVAQLAKETNQAVWYEHFTNTLAAFSEGNLYQARAKIRKFDDEGIPAVLKHPQVQAAIDQSAKPPSNAAIEAVASGQSPELIEQAREAAQQLRKIDELTQDRAAARDELREKVHGKLCLIGDATTGSVDLKQTPVGRIPGTAVIFAAVNTMITGKYLTVFGFGMSAFATLLVAGGLSVPLMRLKPAAAGACGLAGLAGVSFASVAMLVVANVIISPVTPVAGLLAVYLTSTTYQWLSEYRQKQLVRTIFEAQTNPTIVERLIEAGQAGVAEVLAPKTRQVTVFFAEIANFEELAGKIASERLPEVFSRSFGAMAKIILAKEGTLDRYQGHAMVAFFGAPVYQPDHALRACQAALECRAALNALAESWTGQGLPAPRIQVGLHTGELLVGNITLTARVDYTVAGDNLNIAYRIGELNEEYDSEIMISEATMIRCEKQIEARELDTVRIKGRREPVRAYELMSAKGQLSPDKLQLCGTFTTGLLAFRNRDYTNAIAMFRACRATAPADRPTTLYIERCERELKQTVVETGSVPEKSEPVQ